MVSVVLIAAAMCPAQALRNSGFESNLGYWLTCYENITSGNLVPGSVTWSSEHGGSARMVVSGAPGMIGLCQPTCSTLYAGDSVYVDLTVTNMRNFAGLHMFIGDGYDPAQSQQVDLNNPAAGDYHMVIHANRTYAQGTFFKFWLTAWPGTCTAWVHAATTVSLLEGSGRAPETEQMLLSASPNPARHGTRFSFELASAGDVALDIFDGAGRRVRIIRSTGLDCGRQSLDWNGRDGNGREVPAGVYLARLYTGDICLGESRFIVAE